MKRGVSAGPAAVGSLALIGWILLSCGGGAPAPVEPLPDEDVCSFCRMAISDGRLAAQVARRGGVDHFDDIGCMLDWIDLHGLAPGTVAYVADFGTGAPVLAESAFYVRSLRVPSPMGHGLAAFVGAAAAEEAAGELEGQVLTWGQLSSEHEKSLRSSERFERSEQGGRRQPDER